MHCPYSAAMKVENLTRVNGQDRQNEPSAVAPSGRRFSHDVCMPLKFEVPGGFDDGFFRCDNRSPL